MLEDKYVSAIHPTGGQLRLHSRQVKFRKARSILNSQKNGISIVKLEI